MTRVQGKVQVAKCSRVQGLNHTRPDAIVCKGSHYLSMRSGKHIQDTILMLEHGYHSCLLQSRRHFLAYSPYLAVTTGGTYPNNVRTVCCVSGGRPFNS